MTGLSRQTVINSYARIPGIVWKLGWAPTPTGNPRTQLPPLPLDLLQDKDVLKEFVFRVNTFGKYLIFVCSNSPLHNNLRSVMGFVIASLQFNISECHFF